MTEQKQNKDMPKSTYVILGLFCTLPMGIMGAIFGLMSETSSAITGFLWGIGIAVALSVVMIIGYLGWEWIKKEADKGKLLPFILVGFIAAIIISGFLAINLGNPSCEEYDSDPRGGCISYADDGYETTSTQHWDKFWSTLPVTTIITSLVAVIVRNEMEKNRKS
jgi:hypothetical protein